MRVLREHKSLFEDRSTFKAKFGDELFNRYMQMRNRINDPEWKDMDSITKTKSAEELEYFLDNFTSASEEREKAKKGAKLVKKENGWTVYRILTYEASVFYGKHTKWCISGTGKVKDGRTCREVFEEYDPMCQMYFFIKSDNEKYCITYFDRAGNVGTIQIFDEKNNFVSLSELPEDIPDLVGVPGYEGPSIKFDDEMSAIRETMKAFDFQHNGSYMFAYEWFNKGELVFDGTIKKIFQILLDNGYCISERGSFFVFRRGRYSDVDLDELEEKCQYTPDEDEDDGTELGNAKNVLKKYWDGANQAYIIRSGKQHLNMDEMDAFEAVYENGYNFYVTEQPGMGTLALCSNDSRYGQFAEEITINEFFSYTR